MKEGTFYTNLFNKKDKHNFHNFGRFLSGIIFGIDLGHISLITNQTPDIRVNNEYLKYPLRLFSY